MDLGEKETGGKGLEGEEGGEIVVWDVIYERRIDRQTGRFFFGRSQ